MSTAAADVRLLPIKEWARQMGLSVWTARQMAYSGRIASVKITNKLTIPASEAERLIEENYRPAIAQ